MKIMCRLSLQGRIIRKWRKHFSDFRHEGANSGCNTLIERGVKLKDDNL